jgi:hypothetical protein
MKTGVALLISGAGAIALALLGIWTVFLRQVQFGIPLGWDEAQHALDSLTVASDLGQHDLIGFLRDSSAQHTYPPGLSWFQAPTLLAMAPNDETARFAGLIALGILTILTWSFGVTLASRSLWLAGLLGASFVVGSHLALSLGGQSMDELPVACLLVIALMLHVRWRQTGDARWNTAASLAVLATWMTKYNYAAFLLLAMIIEHALAGEFTATRLHKVFQSFYQPLLVGLSMWFAFDFTEKVRAIVGFVINQASDTHEALWSVMTYYPRAFAGDTIQSWVASSLTAIGLVLAIRGARRPGQPLVWFFLVLSGVLIAVHPNRQERYMMPLLPVAWALAAVGLASLLQWSDAQDMAVVHARVRPGVLHNVVTILLLTAGLLVGIGGLATLPAAGKGDLARRDVVHATTSAMVTTIRPDQPMLLVGTFADYAPYYATWSLRDAWKRSSVVVETDYTALVFPGRLTGSSMDPSPSPEYAKLWTAWRTLHPSYWVATMEVGRESPFRTGDYDRGNAWKLNYVEAIARAEPPAVRVFTDAAFALTVRIYAPRAA